MFARSGSRGPVGEGYEPQVQHARKWGVGRSRSTNETLEPKRETAGGRRGGKASGQGEHRADDHAPDAEPGGRVERPVWCARSSKRGETDAVHRAAPPRNDSVALAKFSRAEAGSGAGSRWDEVAGVRDGPGRPAGRLTPPGAARDVSSATVAESLHTEGRWTATTPGGSSPGGQDRSAGRSDGPQPDLRRGLLGVLLWFPAGAKPA